MFLSNPYLVDGRVQQEAETLTEAGHHVSVIVWNRRNGVKPYDQINGIDIIRIRFKGTQSIIINTLLWWFYAYLVARRYAIDVVHCHDLDTLPIGIWLKNKMGIYLIYDAHEIFGNMVSRNHSFFMVMLSSLLEKQLVRWVDQLITVNNPLKQYFRSIYSGVVTVVMNTKKPLLDQYIPPGNDGVFTVLYVGVLTRSRLFPEVVDALGGLDDIRFIVAGKKEELYDIVEQRCMLYDNVEFLGAIPFSSVLPLTLDADVVLCMIDPSDRNNSIGLANKQFEAMVCGRPIITNDGVYVGQVTEECECGLVVGYSVDDVVDAVRMLRDDKEKCMRLGRNALSSAKNSFNWDNESKKLLEVYDGVGGD